MTLDSVLAEIRACRACAPDLAHAPRPILQVRAETRLLICGQAPGRRVHESGKPFDDPSGDRLRRWMGIDRETFYGHPAIGVAAMAFCYPGTAAGGGDHPPPARCATLWRSRLLESLPKVELTLLLAGRPRCGPWVEGPKARWTAPCAPGQTICPPSWVMPHPSWRNSGWLAHNPWFEAEVTPYLRRRVRDLLAA